MQFSYRGATLRIPPSGPFRWNCDMRLPPRFAPLIYGVIQSGITTGVATCIATFRHSPVGGEFAGHWISSWLFSWAAMLPLVIGISPIIQRIVANLTSSE